MAEWLLSDPMGSVIAELRALNIAAKRVRGNEPAPGDAKNAGEYQEYVLVIDLGGPRLHRTPLHTTRYAIRAYGVTPQGARALYALCSNALDTAGPRYGASSLPIHQSLDESGGSYGADPRTGQPYYEGIFVVMAGAAAA